MSIYLALSMWRREVARQRRREDCCLIFRKKLFNKDKSKLLNINPLSSLGCCLVPTPLSRGGNPFGSASHFPYQGNLPRLLGKARLYYLIVPLLKQRFREMFRQAQHDRKQKWLHRKKQFFLLFSVVATSGRPLFLWQQTHTLSFRA